MWKDLARSLDALQQNAVVRRLVAAPDDAESNADHSILSIEELRLIRSQGRPGLPRKRIRRRPMPFAFAAIRPQLGHDGAAGHGKSQTIANIIAIRLRRPHRSICRGKAVRLWES